MAIFGDSYQRPVYHGGDLDSIRRIYGGDASSWIDLSTGINPSSYPVPTIPADNWARLPGGQTEQNLLQAARDYYQIPDHFDLIAAPGTQSLIQRLPYLLPSNLQIAISKPTYTEHETCWRRAGHKIIALDGETQLADVAIVVSPNNPTGKIYSGTDLQKIREAHLKPGGLFIIDEAFMDMTPNQSAAKGFPSENLIILKSFGKFFGLAGIRLGFATGDASLIQKLRDEFGPWAVSGPAAFIGTAAYQDAKWTENAHAKLDRDAKQLSDLIISSGGHILANTGLFVTAEFDDAYNLFEHLCRHHILTRPFEYADRWLRFGIPANEAAWARLQDALTQYS
ncbi:MAG: threonine-phosphate decarboxylase [Sneathiella sp.]|nr:threonine-phosphate decarboxylase [Sneathiella sp.]